MASNQGGGAPPSGAAALNQQLLQQATALAAAMQNAAAQANNPAGIPALPAIPPAAAVMLNDIAVLSQISQVPENDLRNNPQTLALVQATVLRSIMQQQGLAAPRFPAAAVMPGQLLQQPAAAQPQTRATRGGRASAGAKGKANKASSAPAVAPKPQPKKQSVPKVDPGGKVIWAKVGNNPWWPAKTLQEGKDISFPRNEEPPRPTSIAIRFFGNHEFAWLGSKRQIMDWEDGAENRSQVTQDNFTLAIQEAETYLKSKQLPEIFFQVPATEAAASKRGGKRRVSTKKGTSVVEGMHACCILNECSLEKAVEHS